MTVQLTFALLAWATVHAECSDGVMHVEGTQVHFSTTCLKSLIDCMFKGNTICSVYYYTSTTEEAAFIQPSSILTSFAKPYVYRCYVYEDSYINISFTYIQCDIENIDICLMNDAEHSLFQFAIIWNNYINCLYGAALRNHSIYCMIHNYQVPLTLYKEITYTTTLITISTSTFTNGTTKIATITTTPRQEYHNDYTSYFNVSMTNSSKSIADHDNEDDNRITIIVSVCVVAVLALVLCSFIGIFVRRRHSATHLKKSNVKRAHQHNVIKDNNVNENQNNKSTWKSKSKENKGQSSDCTIESGYTTVAVDNYIRTTDNAGELNAGIYRNIVIPKEETTNNHNADMTNCVDNTKDKLSTNWDSNVDYYNSNVETPSSDYQRLGQEQRDLKNPYQQLLQVQQEQQPVLINQELSSYTLAKPVSGETILQIIDVGAWADKSCDIEPTNENQLYRNTPQDLDA